MKLFELFKDAFPFLFLPVLRVNGKRVPRSTDGRYYASKMIQDELDRQLEKKNDIVIKLSPGVFTLDHDINLKAKDKYLDNFLIQGSGTDQTLIYRLDNEGGGI